MPCVGLWWLYSGVAGARMAEPAKRLTPAQRAYLLGYRRAKSRYRAELREFDDWLSERRTTMKFHNQRNVGVLAPSSSANVVAPMCVSLSNRGADLGAPRPDR
jgi:hypothetical protein